MVAKWWNQSKDGKTSGRLAWDDKKGLTIVKVNDNSKYDGEDRIKKIIDDVALLFKFAISSTLSSLTKSHPSVSEVFSKEIALAKIIDGVSPSISNSSKEIISVGCKKYNNVKLTQASSNGKKSKTEQMNKFINEMANKLNKINTEFDEYCKMLKQLSTNNNTNKYWGFSDDARKAVVFNVKNYSAEVNEILQVFTNNINRALKHTENATDLQLKKLKNLSF